MYILNLEHMRFTVDSYAYFDMGEWMGEVSCVHGHPVRLFNIGRDHYVACDTCKAFMHVGSNLMSSWRQEDGQVWRHNRDSLRGYREVVV